MHDTFNLRRFSHLLLNDVRYHLKTTLVVAATLIVLFALLPFHTTTGTAVYFMILYTGGFIITSFAFKDLHDPQRAYLALMLPCSNLERFLTKWFLTSLGYALAVLFIYYLFSLLSFTVNTFIYHQQFPLLNILNPALWLGIAKYIIIQSIILLGAIVFKRSALLKTLLCIGLFFIGLSLLSVLIAWIFCPTCLQQGMTFYLSTENQHFILWLIAAPLCWIITYLRLTEFELK
jgi:hypothetical protein